MPNQARITRVCVVAGVRSAARALSRSLDRALAGTGLNTGQFTALSALAECESLAPGGAGMAMLARRMAMDRSTLHRNLRPLEQADLIAVAGRRGRRGSTVMLTESGHNALRGAMTAWQKHQTAVVGRLGEAESGRLLANLAHLSDGDPVK